MEIVGRGDRQRPSCSDLSPHSSHFTSGLSGAGSDYELSPNIQLLRDSESTVLVDLEIVGVRISSSAELVTSDGNASSLWRLFKNEVVADAVKELSSKLEIEAFSPSVRANVIYGVCSGLIHLNKKEPKLAQKIADEINLVQKLSDLYDQAEAEQIDKSSRFRHPICVAISDCLTSDAGEKLGKVIIELESQFLKLSKWVEDKMGIEEGSHIKDFKQASPDMHAILATFFPETFAKIADRYANLAAEQGNKGALISLIDAVPYLPDTMRKQLGTSGKRWIDLLFI